MVSSAFFLEKYFLSIGEAATYGCVMTLPEALMNKGQIFCGWNVERGCKK